MTSILHEAYERLLAAFGPQRWWPGDTPFEVLVGAVLVQNTSWKNVELAITNLREEGVLSFAGLHELDQGELEELIRPAGYYKVKARRLGNLLDFIAQNYEGSLEQMFSTSLSTLREELLGVNGIGPETADSILLYAGGLPSFVVDAYTARVLSRHGWIDSSADYHAIQEEFVRQLPEEPALFNEYHALLVELGKRHCKKAAPLCEGCPLEPLLPAGGPLAPEW
jgi:endonuclease-3 related protein